MPTICGVHRSSGRPSKAGPAHTWLSGGSAASARRSARSDYVRPRGAVSTQRIRSRTRPGISAHPVELDSRPGSCPIGTPPRSRQGHLWPRVRSTAALAPPRLPWRSACAARPFRRRHRPADFARASFSSCPARATRDRALRTRASRRPARLASSRSEPVHGLRGRPEATPAHSRLGPRGSECRTGRDGRW